MKKIILSATAAISFAACSPDKDFEMSTRSFERQSMIGAKEMSTLHDEVKPKDFFAPQEEGFAMYTISHFEPEHSLVVATNEAGGIVLELKNDLKLLEWDESLVGKQVEVEYLGSYEAYEVTYFEGQKMDSL